MKYFVLAMMLLPMLAFADAKKVGGKVDQAKPGAPAWMMSSQDEFNLRLKDALKRHDATAMALLVKFPLRVNFSDFSTILVDNPAALTVRFDEIFPKWWLDRVLKSGTSDDWLFSRGKLGIEHGLAWASFGGGEEHQRLRIDVVNVLPEGSETLTKLHFVCETATRNIVIEYWRGQDHFTANFSAWNKPKFPPAAPDAFAKGGWDFWEEGTMGCGGYKWHFESDGVKIDAKEGNCTYAVEKEMPNDALAEIITTRTDKEPEREFCF